MKSTESLIWDEKIKMKKKLMDLRVLSIWIILKIKNYNYDTNNKSNILFVEHFSINSETHFVEFKEKTK